MATLIQALRQVPSSVSRSVWLSFVLASEVELPEGLRTAATVASAIMVLTLSAQSVRAIPWHLSQSTYDERWKKNRTMAKPRVGHRKMLLDLITLHSGWTIVVVKIVVFLMLYYFGWDIYHHYLCHVACICWNRTTTMYCLNKPIVKLRIKYWITKNAWLKMKMRIYGCASLSTHTSLPVLRVSSHQNPVLQATTCSSCYWDMNFWHGCFSSRVARSVCQWTIDNLPKNIMKLF